MVHGPRSTKGPEQTVFRQWQGYISSPLTPRSSTTLKRSSEVTISRLHSNLRPKPPEVTHTNTPKTLEGGSPLVETLVLGQSSLSFTYPDTPTEVTEGSRDTARVQPVPPVTLYLDSSS